MWFQHCLIFFYIYLNKFLRNKETKALLQKVIEIYVITFHLSLFNSISLIYLKNCLQIISLSYFP